MVVRWTSGEQVGEHQVNVKSKSELDIGGSETCFTSKHVWTIDNDFYNAKNKNHQDNASLILTGFISSLFNIFCISSQAFNLASAKASCFKRSCVGPSLGIGFFS